MDEDYLNDLLNQVSLEKGQQNSDIDMSMYEDSDVSLDLSDLGDISLEELDDLDALDLSDLSDLDDIDFDDIDITSLKTQQTASSSEPDLNLDALLGEDNPIWNEMLEEVSSVQGAADDFSAMPEDIPTPAETASVPEQGTAPSAEDMLSEVEQSVSGDVFQDASMQMEQDVSIPVAQDVASMDLDDLFSALGIEDDTKADSGESAYTAGQEELDAMFQNTTELSMEMGDLDDIEDIDELKSETKKKKKEKGDKKKKTISEILFGEPEEGEEEEERLLAEKREQKRVQREQKKEEKNAQKAEKQETLAVKKKADETKKKKELEAKKKKKQEELEAFLEEEKNAKKVPTPVVALVFLAFISLAVLVIFGTKAFHYNRAIKHAADYFERQRYRLAYDEVSGVDVKPKDQELKDRIYTVMYVERLYESYQNNMQLNRPDVALDALLRGLEKYDEHYDEAVELQIVDDIDFCRREILTALAGTFRISESEAYAIIALEGQAYSQSLLQHTEGLRTGE